jgi:hypothetical protein
MGIAFINGKRNEKEKKNAKTCCDICSSSFFVCPLDGTGN